MKKQFSHIIANHSDNIRMMKVALGFLIALAIPAYAEDVEPLPTGNFSLPKSQRPGAFYSFGSKILDKGQIQVATKPNYFKESQVIFFGMPNQIQYGTSDRTSVFVAFPATLYYEKHTPTTTTRDTGFDNLGLQGEYEFFTRKSLTDSESADAIFGATLPTGSLSVTQHWSGFFFAGSYNHTWVDWIIFSSAGYLLFEGPTKIRPGDVLFYEVGTGRDLISESGKYNLTAFLELNGQYNQVDPALSLFISGINTPVQTNSARNFSNGFTHTTGSVFSDGVLLFMTPSLWFSTKQWIIQLGASLQCTNTGLTQRSESTFIRRLRLPIP